MRVIAAAVAIIALVGCSGTAAPSQSPRSHQATTSLEPQVSPSPTPLVSISPTIAETTPAPSSTSEPLSPPPTPTPTAAPTASPTGAPAPTEPPVGVGEQGDVHLIVFGDRDFLQAQVVQEVVNTGGGWIELSPFESTYAIYAPDGTVSETGSFTYAYPRFLGPGQKGYLAEDVYPDVGRDELGRVEVDAYYQEIDQPDVLLTVANLKVRKADYGGGLEATGEVVNESAEQVDSATVGVFFLDAAGKPLGFAYTNLVDNIAPNGKKPFTTVGDTPKISPNDVAQTLTFASDESF